MNDFGYIELVLPGGSKAVLDSKYEVTEEPTDINCYPYILHMDMYPNYCRYVCFGPEPGKITADIKWDMLQRVAENYEQYLFTLYYNIERNYLGNYPEAEAFPDGWRTFIELIPFFDMRDADWSAYDIESALFNGNTPSGKPAIIVAADCDVF